METDVAVGAIARYFGLDPADLAAAWAGIERGHVATRHEHVVRQLVAKLKAMLLPAAPRLRAVRPEHLVLPQGLN